MVGAIGIIGGDMKALTFVIPLGHPEAMRDWTQAKRLLAETARSIAHQDNDDWRAIVVASEGADLPELPEGFEVKRVDFPPNRIVDRSRYSKIEIDDAIRYDKGRRILAGMLHAEAMGHVMVMDHDDFVSRRLTSFVAANRQANGWYLRDGYLWSVDGPWLYRYTDFSRRCGTSHIVRADLYQLPASMEKAEVVYTDRLLGSHMHVRDDLAARGTPLEPLPFIGAVYRVGHGESHIFKQSVLKEMIFSPEALREPWRIGARLARLRWKTRATEKEFFGTGD